MLLPSDTWNELWADLPIANEARDRASDAVIGFLGDHGLQPSDQSSDDDPILTLQGAMELGYLLALHDAEGPTDSPNNVRRLPI